MQISVMGIGWYSRDDYPRVLAIMEDAHKLPPTYDEFLKGFDGIERQLKARGMRVVRAVIKPDEFITWCRERGLKVDAQARMRFGSECAARVVRDEQ